MCDSNVACRITRVVDGADREMQLAQLQVVMQRIQTALCNVSVADRIYLGNELLNLAVQKLVGDTSEASTRKGSIKSGQC